MELKVFSPTVAEAEVRKYTLVGDDIYIKKYTAETVPEWYRQLISDIIATDDTITNLKSISNFLETLPTEYSQQILNLQNNNETINANIQSLITKTDTHTAAIANLDITKIDANSAKAIALSTVGSYFTDGSAESWFNNQINTYADAISANAINISTLTSALGDVTANVTEYSKALVSQYQNPNWIDDGFQTDPDINGNTRWITIARAKHSLEVNADGNIVGYVAEANGSLSEFTIIADKFKIANGTENYIPFTINTKDHTVEFNGKVSFSNVKNTPVINKTWIQATKPASDMIAGDTWIDIDDNNKMYSYDGTMWNPVGAGVKTYLQSEEPIEKLSIGDIWVDNNNNYKQYRYNGSSWIPIAYNPATDINNGTTTIDGGKITTGTITADHIKAKTITTNHISIEGLNAKVLTSGIIYNSGGNEQNYSMKIDLDHGYIHIK